MTDRRFSGSDQLYCKEAHRQLEKIGLPEKAITQIVSEIKWDGAPTQTWWVTEYVRVRLEVLKVKIYVDKKTKELFGEGEA